MQTRKATLAEQCTLKRLALGAALVLHATFILGCSSFKGSEQAAETAWLNSFNEQSFHKGSTFVANTTHMRPWYEEFNRPLLTELIETAFNQNLSITQALSRLEQAKLSAGTQAANRYPSLTANLSTTRSKGNQNNNSGWNDSNTQGLSLRWEVDLFKRLSNQSAKSISEYRASQADLKAIRLLISAEVSALYFDILEHLALVDLIEAQIETNRQFLELTQLRKSTGQGSILDIQQQALQLLASQAQLPETKRNLNQLFRSLSVLLGGSPLVTNTYNQALRNTKPKLPTTPRRISLPEPKQLLTRIPTLEAAFLRLGQLDLDVAIASANRLPTLSLNANYDKSRSDALDPLSRSLTNFTLNLTQPLFNAGKLKKNQGIKIAVYEEAIEAFKAAYLSTLADVNNAVADKTFRQTRLSNTQERLQLAKQNVAEAQFQYANGLTDYLNVLVSLTTLQPLEVQSLKDQGQLLDAHIQLHLATGGPMIQENQHTHKDLDLTTDNQ